MKKELNFLIICADFYKDIADVMINKAKSYLDQNEYSYEVSRVSGSFEIPTLISLYDDEKIQKYDGIVALGCIIRGETKHFDFISSSIIDGIMFLSINKKIPIGNGILTCDNMDQVKARYEQKPVETIDAVISVLRNLPAYKDV
tara:strand:+ start:1466 stop:1897 length:432 start_codon:yes stop_codon:yes gene_type:complete